MNTRIGVIVLAVVCLGLGIGLFATKKKANDQKELDSDTIFSLSNKWVSTSDELTEQRNVNVQLSNDISNRNAQVQVLTNHLTTQLASTLILLASTEESYKAAQEQIARETAKIAELESQNQALDQQALDLTSTINNLNTSIAQTQQKLDASEGDKAFLTKELQRLMAEKAELEQKFNDLEILRAQVKHLKTELALSRRLEWIRKGLFGDQKGAEKMMQQTSQAKTAEAKPQDTTPKYNLNVEVDADGSIRVTPANTNSPAATP